MRPTRITFPLLLLSSLALHAQRGTIAIPVSGDITIPAGAQICADTIYANNPGYGTLALANVSCICTGAVVIPVELLSLSASYHEGTVSLVWRTISETNSAAYEVQRTAGREIWTSAGSVPGNGTTTQEHAYALDDRLTPELMNAGTLRYRLKQIDLDGKYEFSPEVEVVIDATARGVVFDAAFPNPVSDRLTVRYSLPHAMPVRIVVYSLSGQKITVFEGGELSGSGEHMLSIDTSSLTPGAYMLELAAGDRRLVRQFVARR